MRLENLPASALVEDAPEPVLILDSEGNVKYLNRSFDEWFPKTSS